MDIPSRNVAARENSRKKRTSDRLKFYIASKGQSHQMFANMIKAGLSSEHKFLLPQYFYDQKGSKLFERISEQPEYYLTRLEASILESSSDEIANIGVRRMLVELGSGNSRKTRIILDALQARQESIHYLPVDVSYDMLKETSETLLNEYQNLSITALVADYYKGMSLIRDISSKKLILFLGSSLGNFDPIEGGKFMRMIRNHIQEDDMVLIGVDMHKDSTILNAAYNDSQGVTAQFNLNILVRINRELGGDFYLEKFEHQAFYRESEGRVEMHLISKAKQDVHVAGIGATFSFENGERIHTESSCKFTFEQIEKMIDGSFQMVRMWTDDKKWYSLILLAPIA